MLNYGRKTRDIENQPDHAETKGNRTEQLNFVSELKKSIGNQASIFSRSPKLLRQLGLVDLMQLVQQLSDTRFLTHLLKTIDNLETCMPTVFTNRNSIDVDLQAFFKPLSVISEVAGRICLSFCLRKMSKFLKLFQSKNRPLSKSFDDINHLKMALMDLITEAESLETSDRETPTSKLYRNVAGFVIKFRLLK